MNLLGVGSAPSCNDLIAYMQVILGRQCRAKACAAVQTVRRVKLRSICNTSFGTRHRHLFQRLKHKTASIPAVTARLPHDAADKRAKPAIPESSGSVMQSLRRYPLTVAFGSLFLVFVLPKVMTFGLVGVERTALAFLLEMEEILVAVLLAGAKWVALAATCAGMLALLWFETKKRRS